MGVQDHQNDDAGTSSLHAFRRYVIVITVTQVLASGTSLAAHARDDQMHSPGTCRVSTLWSHARCRYTHVHNLGMLHNTLRGTYVTYPVYDEGERQLTRPMWKGEYQQQSGTRVDVFDVYGREITTETRQELIRPMSKSR